MSTSSSNSKENSRSQDPQTQSGVGASQLPIESYGEAKVYNLTVLVRVRENNPVTARAANLTLTEVEASTIRQALSQLVESAKIKIREQLDRQAEIPWIDPPNEPAELESRYVVPLHL
ncbi:MAG: hypothetical protein AAF483_16505 [Planctomycetota bacterium]